MARRPIRDKFSRDEIKVLRELNRRNMSEEELARVLGWPQAKTEAVLYSISHARPPVISRGIATCRITRPGRAVLNPPM
jgi:hypothetical protein